VIRNPGIPVIGAIYSEGNLIGNGSSATISGADNCGIVADVTAIYGKFSNPSFLQLINKVVEVPTQNS